MLKYLSTKFVWSFYMFGTTHILYMLISAVLSAVLLVFLYFKANDERSKTWALRAFAIITVIIHYSSLWVNFFATGELVLEESQLLPIHPCNICMWLLLACSLIKNRDSRIFKIISEFTFWGGVVCGSIGIIINENFGANPTLADYSVLKGMLSHSTMVLGCIYLLVSGMVRIRVSNVISVIAGLAFFVVDGSVINALYAIFDREPCNSMYMLELPFPDLPWLNTLTMGIAGVAVAFLLTALYELLALPAEERWYSRLKRRYSK